MAHSRHLALEDLRLARDPDHLLALFRRLAYRTEPELVPLDPADLEFPERAGIQRCFLLADHPGPPGLQVFLFELDGVRMAELPGTNWFVVDEAGDPTQRRKIPLCGQARLPDAWHAEPVFAHRGAITD